MRRFMIAGAAFLLGTAILGESNIAFGAQQDASPAPGQTPAPPTPKPQYDPTADAIVGGLKGIVTGTQATLDGYRATARFVKFRNALADAFFVYDKDKPIQLAVSDYAVLCSVREPYVQMSADAAYINSLTQALDKVATPAQISTLGDAIVSFFNKYSIEVKGNAGQAKPGVTSDACISDLKNWAADYYDIKEKLHGLLASSSPPASGIDGFLADVSAISGLANAIVAIITPLVKYAANAHNAVEINTVVDGYLHNAKENNGTVESVMKAAADLASAVTDLTNKSRYQAVGQFAEKLAAVREVPIDLSKLKEGDKLCVDLIKTPTEESEKFPVATDAATPASNTVLHFDTVPGWIQPGMNIYGAGIQVKTADQPLQTTVASFAGPIVVMSTKAGKFGVAKGTVVEFASDKDHAELETSAATPADDATLHFETLPSWIASGVKISGKKPNTIPDKATVVSVGNSEVVMSVAAVGGGVAAKGTVQFTFPKFTDGFVSCFAQAWKQISPAVSDAITAATAYDVIAQASDNKLTAAITSVKTEIELLLIRSFNLRDGPNSHGPGFGGRSCQASGIRYGIVGGLFVGQSHKGPNSARCREKAIRH